MPQKCLVIGHPISHSVSPAFHNYGYELSEIQNDFIFEARDVLPENLEEFANQIRTEKIRGVSCTIPHKIEIIPFLDKIDPLAEKIGAVNTVVNENGVLYGYNTDYIGIIKPLYQTLQNTSKISKDLKFEDDFLSGKKLAIIGAGGASRAVLYGVLDRGISEVCIFNRTLKKAEDLIEEAKKTYPDTIFTAKTLQSPPIPLTEGGVEKLKIKDNFSSFDIIINSTAVGMSPNVDETPVPSEFLNPNQIVFDIVYNPKKTKLILDAEAKGCSTILGLEMFLYQGLEQFVLYTKKEAPEDKMRIFLEEKLG